MDGAHEIIGHEEIRSMLTRAIAHERLAHAYIFSGPAHVGKTTVAEWLSRAVLCERPTQTRFPCDQCRACAACRRGTHPDVIVTGVPVDGGEISVDAVRGLRSALERSAFMQGYQVAIITDADALTVEAENSLLKILEEPRGKTLIMLTATNVYRLLPTIRSRAVTIRFAPVSTAAVTAACRAWGASAEDAVAIAVLADGSVGRARQFVDDRHARAAVVETMDTFLSILEENGWASRRRQLEAVIEQWKNVESVLLMQGVLRRILRDAVGMSTRDHSVLAERVGRIAARANPYTWIRCIDSFSSLMEILRTTNVSPLLAWEQFLFTLP